MKNKLKNLLFVLSALLLVPLSARAQWAPLEKGLAYQESADGQVHFLRVDPARFRIDLLLATDYDTPILTAQEYRERSGAAVVVNGGFFDEFHHSLGLIQRRGRMLNPLRMNSWGIFSIEGNRLAIVNRKEWKGPSGSTALQVGPRLLVGGRVQKFKESYPARRSAVGLTKGGEIVIAVSEKPLYLKEWAEILKVDCVDALNLDGGGSTQLSASTPKIKIRIDGETAVPNAVAVFRR